MATNTAGNAGQEYHTNQVHYLIKKITYADDGTTVTVGTLPENAAVLAAHAVVTEAFNGNSTNTVDIGVTGNTDDFVTDVSLATVGVVTDTDIATATSAFSTSSRDVVAVVVSTASASAGVAYIVVQYVIYR